MDNDAILQQKLTEIKQQLNEMKTSQWGREDSWTPYQYETSTEITPSGRVYPTKYYKVQFISPVKQPAIFFFFYGEDFPYTATWTFSWGTNVVKNVGSIQPYYIYYDDFEPVWYVQRGGQNLTDTTSPNNVKYTDIGQNTVIFKIFSSQPGALKFEEITQSEYNANAYASVRA